MKLSEMMTTNGISYFCGYDGVVIKKRLDGSQEVADCERQLLGSGTPFQSQNMPSPVVSSVSLQSEP